MYKRKISGSITKNTLTDLKDGGYAAFSVDSDTGAGASNARPTAAWLTVGDIRCYATTAYLAIRFNDEAGDVLACTGALSGTSSTHTEEFELSALAKGLVTAEPSTVYLCVVATSGTGNKINFREGCTFDLEIEYALPQELLPWTDPALTARKTLVKAVHMTELQTNINRQREGLGLAPYTFTEIRAGYTSLADWTAHVEELRAAIDETGVQHAAWNEITVNCPDMLEISYLRLVVEAIL